MSDNVFQIRGLSFAYGKHTVLKGLDLDLHAGRITTLIGANGCGKSTLFHLMTKNLRPDAGRILLRDQDISACRLRDFARQVAIVHQYNTAPADLSVEKLVAYGRTPYQTMGLSPDPEADAEKIRWALEITHTDKYRDKPVAELSGGQKQRVWIAMALAQGTQVLFLDEPTTYLDIRYQLQILHLIRQLNREYGMTVIMVLHEINQAIYFSDRIIGLCQGKVLIQGEPDEVITGESIRQLYGIDLKVTEIDGHKFVLTV